MENRPLVLVVDDQTEITKLVAMSLQAEGFRVLAATNGPQALAQLTDTNPDVVLLDIMMPGMSGIEVLKEMREHHPVPIILLSARSSAASVSEGLDLGADDYVTKPFHPTELGARIRAVMRRSRRGMVAGRRRIGPAVVDLDRRTVAIGNAPVRMSRNEWLLLELFLANDGRILLHHEILSHVWGPEYRDEVAYLRLWIGQLRRKLGVLAWEEGPIRTVQGLGYVFDPTDQVPRMQSRRPRRPSTTARGAERPPGTRKETDDPGRGNPDRPSPRWERSVTSVPRRRGNRR